MVLSRPSDDHVGRSWSIRGLHSCHDTPAGPAAVEYLQTRRARGYLSRDHAWLISSFLDGLAAQNATTITRATVLA
ncbi:MAG: hypothetical protein ACRDR6_30410, partial [Pseudonocardiaceae bacterium]